jgi:hypothetical protein
VSRTRGPVITERISAQTESWGLRGSVAGSKTNGPRNGPGPIGLVQAQPRKVKVPSG